MKKLTTLLVLALISSSALADEAPMTLSVKRLTADVANKIAVATIDACRKEAVHIAVSVVDRNGVIQAVLRDTLAMHLTLDISHKKAYTAANFNALTSTLQDRATTAVGRSPQLMMSAGGVPINIGGYLFGGIGVSGAPSGETDEKCAQAGLDAIAEDLEMDL